MELEKGEKVVCIDRKNSNILIVGKVYTIKSTNFNGEMLHFENEKGGGFNGRLFIRLSEYRKLKIKKIKDGLCRKIQG